MRIPDTERLDTEITCLKLQSEVEPGFEPSKCNYCPLLSLARMFELPNCQPKRIWGGIPFLCSVSGGTLYTRLPVTNSGLPAILTSSTRLCPLQHRKRKIMVEI